MRTVLITGTSSGIGRATALRLARNNWRVFAGVRKQADGQDLIEEHGDNNTLIPISLDVTDEGARQAAINRIEAEADQLDALINNAGSVSAGPLECLDINDIRFDLETNLISAIALTQLCIPLLRKSGGRIVNVGSAQDLLTPPYFGGYTISKWGMRGFHEALRLELRPWNLECILVVPGGVKTRIWEAISTMVSDLDNMSADARNLYRPLGEAMQAASTNVAENGVAADVVAKAIESALQAKRPKPEVIVGGDAKYLMRPIGWLPTRFREAIEARVFKLP